MNPAQRQDPATTEGNRGSPRSRSSSQADVAVRVEDVGKEYLLGEQRVVALAGVTLNIERGVFLALAGPSGSGKSTLLNMIGCIDTPTRGRIAINGQDLGGRTPDELASLRARTIGFIFQTFNLFPVLSAEENVAYPLHHRDEISARERRDRVRHYLEVVGLTDFARHRPNQLSGGQRQRVAIARALRKSFLQTSRPPISITGPAAAFSNSCARSTRKHR